MVDGMFVNIGCKTQGIIATSSGEAELYGIGNALLEALGLRSQLSERGHDMEVHVRCDSSSARAIALRLGVGRLKHLDVKLLWIQEVLKQPHMKLTSIKSADNPADIGTKPGLSKAPDLECTARPRVLSLNSCSLILL
jgi:hypothetical protein